MDNFYCLIIVYVFSLSVKVHIKEPIFFMKKPHRFKGHECHGMGEKIRVKVTVMNRLH